MKIIYKNIGIWAISLIIVSCSSSQRQVANEANGKVNLVILDPGHFHASLLQKDTLAAINDTIWIYAPKGIEVDQYLKSIDSYNQRAEKPTAWVKQLYTADDYLSKPFNPLELTARVKSQLRRYTQLNPQSGAGNQVKNEISIKGLTINKDNHKVTVYGEEIKLTPIEFDILYLLASNPGRVFSTDEIFEKVWNEKVYEANNTVMVHIRRLRGKMKEDTRQNKIITTVWGVGYKIEK